MPPVPKITTRKSCGKESIALRIALPSMKQRWPVGGGYWITLTQSGITLNGHRLGWPHIGDRKAFGAAQGEGRDHLQRKRRGMVVIDQEHDIRLQLRQPLLREFVAGKDLLPIGLAALAIVERRADRWHMRGGDTCEKLSHGSSTPICCDCRRASGRPRPSSPHIALASSRSSARRDSGRRARRSRRASRCNRCCRQARA